MYVSQASRLCSVHRVVHAPVRVVLGGMTACAADACSNQQKQQGF